MLRTFRAAIRVIAVVAIFGVFASAAAAGTIMRLSPGESASHIKFESNVLTTASDGNATTTGEHNTAVQFQGILEDVQDIPLPNASVTISGITRVGLATVFPNQLMMQNFTGGTVSLYDESNTLLLSGSLKASTLAGSLGATGANDGLFTTSFNVVTGGTLRGRLRPDSITLKMNIRDINEGAGLSAPGRVLEPFTGDALLTITGEVPEPGTFLLMLAGMGIVGSWIGRRR
jgi:hypothetical protein